MVRQLDQAYSIRFKGPGSKGSQNRARVFTGLKSTRKFRITGLPISCLDPEWLSTLTGAHKEIYDIQLDEDYDFDFPAEFLQGY
jgi:hypothetical protein